MSEKIDISYSALKKLVLKAYQICNGIPSRYPTVELLDEMIDNRLYNTSEQYREDVYKYCIRYLTYGFDTDKKWHKYYPNHKEPTAENLLKYLYTPLEKIHGYEPHAGVWDSTASEEEQEDRRAAFEYMQSIIMDKNIYTISLKNYVAVPEEFIVSA